MSAGHDAPPGAVVLLSGGMDSAVTLALLARRGFRCRAISFDYGQRHRIELECARRVAAAVGVAEHCEMRIDLRAFGGSALTAEVAVPKDRDLESGGEIPITYVPARNTVFLSLALAFAESRGLRDLAIGVNAVDYSGYPDCRVEAAARGEPHFRLHAPLEAMSKGEIVRRGAELGLDLGLTTSCYDPSPLGRPCGRCDACRLRARGFAEAGLPDPAAD